jgi:hypothetical protein
MTTDPRLQNTALLALAAVRIRQRRLVVPRPHWEDTVGLASLLEVDKGLPRRDPWAVDGLEACGPLGRMLAEARRLVGEEGGHA